MDVKVRSDRPGFTPSLQYPAMDADEATNRLELLWDRVMTAMTGTATISLELGCCIDVATTIALFLDAMHGYFWRHNRIDKVEIISS